MNVSWLTANSTGWLQWRKMRPSVVLILAALGGNSGIALGAEGEAPIVAALTLEQSLRFAEEHNPQLVAAHEKVRSAEAGIVEMRSGLYPHLDASAGVFHLESPPTLTLGPLSVPIGREDMRFINVGATQTLYAGGRIQGGIESARLARVDAKERLRALSREVAAQVKNAFYGVLFARELVRVRQDALALLQEHLATTQARFRQGTAAEFDMLRADVEVANARPPLIEVENQLATAEERFKRALGFDLDSAVSVNGELRQRPVPFAGAEAAAESAAYACRAEVEAARAAVRLADTQTRIARAGDKPTVSLSANYFGTSPEYFMAPSEDLRWNWMAGVNVTLPLFSGFETRGRVAKFQAESAGALAQVHDVEQQVRLETRQAFLRIKEAEELVRSQAQNVVQAEKALRIARRRYEQGLGTQLDVTDSRVALTQARVNELSALYRHELAVAELDRAVGCPPGTPTEGREGDEP
ncbi:MAG: TolC family protein [Nitrospirota bacterium]